MVKTLKTCSVAGGADAAFGGGGGTLKIAERREIRKRSTRTWQRDIRLLRPLHRVITTITHTAPSRRRWTDGLTAR